MPDLLASLQEVLGDRYQLEGELGHGGMSTVYRALDRKLNRPVAIKVLSPELALILGSDRFRREIDIATKLQHPNIVPLFDSGGKDDVLFYVMPLISGETLRDRLERETQLPLDDALRIIRDVADAVGHAHAQGFVHRDIKPENILLAAGRVYVADFGIARAIDAAGEDRLTSAGIVLGTPAYMSPEQAGGKSAVDGRADLYAMGCVLYEMLAGRPPFAGATPQAVLAQQMSAPVPSLHIERDTVTPPLEAVIERTLAKAPADRYPTASRLIAALDDAAAGRGPSRPRSRRVARRWAAGLALAVVAAGLLLRYGGFGGTLDPNKVMGFPLRSQDGAPAGSGLQASFAIENALPYAAPLRWADPWPYLDLAVRENPALLDARAARRIARLREAGHYVLGSVGQTADSLQVALELYDTRTDSLVSRQVASAAVGTPVALLALRATNALLPHLLGHSTHVDDSWLVGRQPGAVASWLQGEVDYRHARYDGAMTHYRQALAEDSMLIVAAIKGAMAATWVQEYPLGDTLVQLALRHERQLPARSVRFARGLRFFFEGTADSALVHFRSAVNADPDWSEGWYGLGEVYMHLIPAGTGMDSLAEQSFARAVRLDSAFAPAIFHLAQFALRRGDVRGAARLVHAYTDASTDSARDGALEESLACIRDGPAHTDFGRVARAGVAASLEAGLNLSAGLAQPACAERAFRAGLLAPGISDAERWAAVSGLHHLSIARGDVAKATRLIDSLLNAGARWPGALIILDGTLDLVPRERVVATLAPYLGPIDHMALNRLSFAAAWYRHTGDTVRLDSARARYAELGRAGDAGAAAAADAAGAWLALLRRDTTAALRRFLALRPGTDVGMSAWRFWEPMAAERLELAELLLAKGRAQEALDLGGEFDRELSINLMFLRPSLDLRRRAAERLGRAALAHSYQSALAAAEAPGN